MINRLPSEKTGKNPPIGKFISQYKGHVLNDEGKWIMDKIIKSYMEKEALEPEDQP